MSGSLRTLLLVPFVAQLLALVSAAPPTSDGGSDPCAKIAGKLFAPPADVRACFKSFPFNETVRQNVITVHERVFNFYSFEDFYLKSPPPFQESTVNIRGELARIKSAKYKVSVTGYGIRCESNLNGVL
jgi:hypothetical protein